LTADFLDPIVAARPTNQLISSEEAGMVMFGRSHASRPVRLGAMLLVLLIIVPLMLAHASPADQTWIAGIYDQADFDDVVGLLTSVLEDTDSTAAPEPRHCLALARKLGRARVAYPASAPAYSAPLRAPPIA